jgi:predicted membrane protein
MSATLGGGDVSLRGDWTGDMTLDVTVAVGGLQVRVPRDAGVKVTALTHLGGIDAAGFTEKNGDYTSPNYATATRKVLITGSVSLGGLKVTWVDQ